MAQDIYLGSIDPDNTSGTQLGVIIDNLKNSLLSMNAGAARPAYAVANTMWAKSVSSTITEIYLFDGAADILQMTINPTDHSLIAYGLSSIDGSANVGPSLTIDRLSPTPAPNDFLGQIWWRCKNALAATVTAANIVAQLIDATAAAEKIRILFYTTWGGASAARLALGQGLYTPNATGGDPGLDAINAKKYAADGADLTTGQVLADAATIAWSMALGPIATVTLGGNRTMGAPTGLVAYKFYSLTVINGAAWTLAFDAAFVFAGASVPTVTPTAGKRDVFTFASDGAKLYEVGRSQNM